MNPLFYIKESECEDKAVDFFVDCACLTILLLTVLFFVLIEM